ncbi:MAG: DUF3047 domain-containing protein [Bacteroidota bacterium]
MHTRLAALLFATIMLVAAGWAAATITVGNFAQGTPGDLPDGWEPMELGDADRSTYALVRDGDTTVLEANADDSASGLIRRLNLPTEQFPILEWRWKAENVLADGDISRKDGDDYPARIYITFDYDVGNLSFGERLKYRAINALVPGDIPIRALTYVWANKAGETQIVPNAYTDWVMMVPVQSGPAGLGTWQNERRNIAEDYRRAFGEEPPPISGIAVMTDADNTGGQAKAYYGNILLKKE